MSDKTELLPCPFCGCKDLALSSNGAQSNYFSCNNCGAETGGGDDEEEAVAIWNSRAAITAPPAAEQPYSTTSDKIRAELYDEAWEEARALGFGSVKEALSALARQQLDEQPDTVKVPRELLKEAADEIAHLDRQWRGDDAMGLRMTPPRASRLMDKLRSLLEMEGEA